MLTTWKNLNQFLYKHVFPELLLSALFKTKKMKRYSHMKNIQSLLYKESLHSSLEESLFIVIHVT